MAKAADEIRATGLDRAYEAVRDEIAAGIIPNGLLAVASGSRTIRCEAFDRSGTRSTDGVYLLASITKPIMATAVMQLVEQGRLLVQDRVTSHIPEFAANGKDAVTVWHLLTHTSGMDESFVERIGAGLNPENYLAGAVDTGLLFAPGTSYRYCNVSFRILAEIVQQVSGLTYQEYLHRYVLEPLGMNDTTFRPGDAQIARVVPVASPNVSQEWLKVFYSLEMPAGGLFSTASDLISFGRAFLPGTPRERRVLSSASIAVMTRDQTAGIYDPTLPANQPVAWGLGWGKTQPARGMLSSPSGFGHAGITGTNLWIEPELDLVVVFLTSIWQDGHETKRRVLNAVLAAFD